MHSKIPREQTEELHSGEAHLTEWQLSGKRQTGLNTGEAGEAVPR